MANTGAEDHVEQAIRKLQSGALGSSSDLEAFCASSLRLLLSPPLTYVTLHDDLVQFSQCGKLCKFCRYLYASFGEDMAEAKERSKTKRGPEVTATISTVHIEERSKPVDRVQFSVRISEPYPGNSYFRRFELLCGGARGIERAVWSYPGPVHFDARVPTLRRWLSECIHEHPKCGNAMSPDAPFAARILEVLTLKGNPILRLVFGDNFDYHHQQYAVLSHCWGGVDIPAKTTRANVDKYFVSIDIETLPKTFREAIEISRALQLRFLWIDSLTIIQHDPPDWQCESAKMATIFRNATITISASTAENSTQGCGITSLLPPSTQFTLPRGEAREERPPYLAICQTSHIDHPFPGREYGLQFYDYPVHKRAWIFQEKILSRRILHATHGLFMYQCATHFEDEDGLHHYRDSNNILASHIPEHVVRPSASHNRGHDDIRRTWWTWMGDFAKRQLTQPADNYAALAGVTALYRDLTGDEPVLAMWKRDLVVHLAWEVHVSEDGKGKFTKYSASERQPSWTWMSYPHGTVLPDLDDVEFNDLDRALTPQSLSSFRYYKAEVMDIDIRWTGQPLVTSPEYAAVKLRGLKHRLSKKEHEGHVTFDLDVGIAVREDKDMYDVFALYANRNEPRLKNSPWRLHTAYLALEAVEGDSHVYRRIGRIMLYEPIASGKTAENHLLGTYEDITVI